jgi:hypothetical protein
MNGCPSHMTIPKKSPRSYLGALDKKNRSLNYMQFGKWDLDRCDHLYQNLVDFPNPVVCVGLESPPFTLSTRW